MSILKWALYGGAAYLGYRVLTKPSADDVVNAAKMRLDPKLSWTIHHSTGTDGWNIAGWSVGQAGAAIQSQLFVGSRDALAWIETHPLTGAAADVKFSSSV